ncbi:hypothetical protein KDA11_06890, partial [Candidatus Saccharibacteria bacterium]|nr:hypothetical protein [Candidatus Saccharibacteria bacterium]
MAFISKSLPVVRLRTYHPIVDYEDTDVLILPKLIKASQALKLAVQDQERNNTQPVDLTSLGITLSLEEILAFMQDIDINHIEIKYEQNAPMYYRLCHYLFDNCILKMTVFTRYLISMSTAIDETNVEIIPSYIVPEGFEALLTPDFVAEFGDADIL